jgi:hypothetical protein
VTAKPGTAVQVMHYPTAADRDAGRDGILREVVITSAGPPGLVADWGRTTGPDAEWVLVRKARNTGGHRWEAVRGDRGETGN